MDPQDAIEVRRLEPGDADALIACFERCYGDTYPSNDFYSPEVLRDRIEQGTLRSVVAVQRRHHLEPGGGRLVGHTGLTVRAEGQGVAPPLVAVAGNTIVDPEYRGKGVLDRLLGGLVELSRSEGFVGYVHYPTTAHTIIQKRSVRRQGVETGIHLAYLPADTDYREIDQGSGRLAATVVYQPFSRAPSREVYLPDRYRELLSDLYLKARLERTVLPSVGGSDRITTLTVTPDDRMGVLRIEVSRTGEDFGDQIRAAVEAHALPLVHVDLVLDDPGVGEAVETLRTRGFLYCGLAPELNRADILRMQRLPAQSDVDPFDVNLANPGAKELLELMRRESKETA